MQQTLSANRAGAMLVSFAAVIRVVTRHATLLPTNGCSRERRIPFPLFLRTNRMHVIVIGYANQIPRYICWALAVRAKTKHDRYTRAKQRS